MWKRSELRRDKKYFIQLCAAPDGDRYLVLTDANKPSWDKYKCFSTTEVSFDLLWKCNLDAIASSIPLVEGKQYTFDAHGVWLIKEEVDALRDPNVRVRNAIQWVTAVPPLVAPK